MEEGCGLRVEDCGGGWRVEDSELRLEGGGLSFEIEVLRVQC